jgi:hypothetical protein
MGAVYLGKTKQMSCAAGTRAADVDAADSSHLQRMHR